MDSNFMSALIKGLPTGLIAALAFIGVRTLISGTGFMSNLGSLYGILTLTCFPAAAVLGFYFQKKKK